MTVLISLKNSLFVMSHDDTFLNVYPYPNSKCKCFNYLQDVLHGQKIGEKLKPNGFIAVTVTFKQILNASQTTSTPGFHRFQNIAQRSEIDADTRNTKLTMICKNQKAMSSKVVPKDQKDFRVYLIGLDYLSPTNLDMMIKSIIEVGEHYCYITPRLRSGWL